MDFYNELMRNKNKDDMNKTASSQANSIDLRKDLEESGISAQEIQVLAASILGMMSKNAEEEIPEVEEVVEQPSAAPIVDPAVEAAAAVSADDQIKEDATDAAIASAKSSINDAASAISTLEAVTSDVPATTEIPVEDPIVPSTDATNASAAMTSDDNQVVAAEGDDGTEKQNESKDEDSDDDDEEDDEDEADDDDKEVEAAMQEYDLIMKEGTEEEKTALINEAYDIALVKLARAGITFEDFVFSKVGGDVDLANTIVDHSIKLAALSGQNYLKVADDMVYQMEKSASEL